MKKLGVLIILLIVITGTFVFAQGGQNISTEAENVKQIQSAIGKLPINNESGNIDFSEYTPLKTNADKRIEKINSYIGPITNIILGVQLSLSWLFAFSVITWLLLIEAILMPVNKVFKFNIVGSIFVSGIVASLSMQSFGKDFAIWMNSLATSWIITGITIFTVVIIGFIYSLIMQYLGIKFKNMKEESKKDIVQQDRIIIHTDSEISKKRMQYN